jgi:hypothetical protein
MVFLMVRSTLTDGRVVLIRPITGARALINPADYWLLRGSRGQNDDPHVAAGVSRVRDKRHVLLNRFLIRVSWTHTQPGGRVPFQRAVNGSWNFFFSIRGTTFFFLNFARTLGTQKINLSKFVCHLYQADCKIFLFVLFFFTSFSQDLCCGPNFQ